MIILLCKLLILITMHTGIISFANRIVYNIKTNDMKDMILEQLYSLYGIKIIQKQYYKLDENNISHIKGDNHLCNLRSNGNPYYMFMTLYNDVPIIYFIDKKVHPGYQKPRILLVRGLFKENLYKNTLMDGEMVRCHDNSWEFLFNDLIVYEGNHLKNIVLPKRLEMLYNLLNTQYTPDSTIDVCQYKIKTYYKPCYESIKKLIELSKNLNYTSRGIYIWPFDLKYKSKLYNFDEDKIINVVRKVKDETKFQMLEDQDTSKEVKEEVKEDINISTSNIMIDNDDEKILWISKTDYPDVYNLQISDNISSEKVGIALIPNLATSKMIRNAFKNKNAAAILMTKCKFDKKFNKWYPIEI